MGHLKMSLAHTSNLITPVAAKEQRRAQRLTSQAASQQRELAWGQASSQRDQHARYLMQQQRGAASDFARGGRGSRSIIFSVVCQPIRLKGGREELSLDARRGNES